MKVANVVQTAINTSTNEDAQEMSIDVDSSVFLMDALGKLYSQPARAALREYLSNAVDAHIEAGGNRPPVEVILPDFTTEMLSVRDYGNGMSEETFNTVVSRYGASTKRGSNKVQGGFGLGAKAGFAIADEFFMTSYQQGKLVKVRIFKNENSKSYLEVVERSNTTEPDGLLVEVPIPRASREEVSFKKLTEAHFFEAYANSEIEVREGANRSYSALRSESVFGDSFMPLEFGGVVVGWASKEPDFERRYSDVRAIIGRVSYTLHLHHGNGDDGKALHKLYNSGYDVVLNIPIGSVDLPSAREEITSSERSRKTISAIASTVLRLIEEKVQKDINTLDSRFDVLTRMAALKADLCPGMENMAWRTKTVPLTFNPDNNSAKFNDEGSAIVFKKTAKGRPSFVATELDSVIPNLFLSSISDTKNFSTVIITVEGEDAFKAAIKKISAGITDYRKSLNIGNGTMQVLLLRSDESLAEWFNHESQMTLDDFNKTVRNYRATVRKSTGLPTASTDSDSDDVPEAVTIAPSRRVQWIGLDEKSLETARFQTGDATTLITGETDCYYLAMDEMKESASAFSQRFKDMLKAPANYYLSESDKKMFASFGSMIGENAKLVFVASGRSTEVFKKNNPDAKPLVPALRAAVDKAWEEVKAGNDEHLIIFAGEFVRMNKRNRAEAMMSFMDTLSEEEKLTLDPAFLEIGKLMSPKLRSESYGNLLIELFDYSEKRQVASWIEGKVTVLADRYPLLANLYSYDRAEWPKMKTHLYEYVVTH